MPTSYLHSAHVNTTTSTRIQLLDIEQLDVSRGKTTLWMLIYTRNS